MVTVVMLIASLLIVCGVLAAAASLLGTLRDNQVDTREP